MSGSWTDDLPLLDHHCHGVVRRDLEPHELAAHATESDWAPAPGTLRRGRTRLRPFPAVNSGESL